MVRKLWEIETQHGFTQYYSIDDKNRLYFVGNDNSKFSVSNGGFSLIGIYDDSLSFSLKEEIDPNIFIVEHIGKCDLMFLERYLSHFSLEIEESTLQKIEMFLKI